VSRRAHGCPGVRVVEPSAEVPCKARPARSPKTCRPAVQPRRTRRRQSRSGRAERAHRTHVPAAARHIPLLEQIAARTVADGSTHIARARIRCSGPAAAIVPCSAAPARHNQSYLPTVHPRYTWPALGHVRKPGDIAECAARTAPLIES
jgi:hypothetical protein